MKEAELCFFRRQFRKTKLVSYFSSFYFRDAYNRYLQQYFRINKEPQCKDLSLNKPQIQVLCMLRNLQGERERLHCTWDPIKEDSDDSELRGYLQIRRNNDDLCIVQKKGNIESSRYCHRKSSNCTVSCSQFAHDPNPQK